MSNQLPQRFATVVMKQAHRFTSVNPSARWEIAKRVNKWLDRIHLAGVMHTDIRSSNIMWLSVKSGADPDENGENMELTVPVASAIGGALSATASNKVGRSLVSYFNTLAVVDPPSDSRSQANVVAVHEEAEGAAATGGREAAATTEAAMGAIGATATAVTLVDNTVEREELMVPIVVDFDCAVLATDGKATVDISMEGARLTLIRTIRHVVPGQRSVEWTPSHDRNMAWKSVNDL